MSSTLSIPLPRGGGVVADGEGIGDFGDADARGRAAGGAGADVDDVRCV